MESLQNLFDVRVGQLAWMTLPDDLAGLVDQKCRRDAADAHLFIQPAAGIGRHGVIHRDFFLEFFDHRIRLVGHTDHHQTAVLVFGVDLVEVRNAFAAGRTPRRPEFEQQRLAREFGLAADVVQRAVR